MPKLVYSAIASLDGYVADEEGSFGWSVPDEEVHRFVNDLERPIGTYLYGRRMYEVMAYWETAGDEPGQPEPFHDYAGIWRAAEKIVFSTTLAEARTERTRIETSFDPAAIAELKASVGSDISIGGPHLAAQALEAGLVDELHLFMAPVVVGGGNPALPDHLRLDLGLLDERRFGNGTVYVRYRVES
jgi:dihydrofolate reductase